MALKSFLRAGKLIFAKDFGSEFGLKSVKTALSLAELTAYDPHEGGRRLCPLCGDGKPRDSAHRSLSFDAQTGLWKCFRCGESGKLREFWENKDNYQPPRQRARAKLRATFDLPSPVPPSPNGPIATPPSSLADESRSISPNETVDAPRQAIQQANWADAQPLAGTAGEKYLQRRGVPLEVALAAEVRFASAWFNHPSVVFPIKNRQNEVIAAQGRAVRGAAKLTSGPKRNGIFFAPALKSHAANSDDVFRPLDRVLPAVILTEAPIDALSLAVCGFPALALCGTSGPDWLHIVCGLRRVLLAFDADEAGDQAAIAIYERLRFFGSKCERLPPPEGKDWNECLLKFGSAALTDWLTSAVLLSDPS